MLDQRGGGDPARGAATGDDDLSDGAAAHAGAPSESGTVESRTSSSLS